MMRYALVVEYDGTHYAGWQRQPALASTVQENVEAALSRVADEAIEVVCAGRTDAGVHALGQVVHFDTTAERDGRAWLAGGNRYLPPDIRLQSITRVRDDFHARYSALKRHYRYVILNAEAQQPSAIFQKRCHWHAHLLDAEKMHAAAQVLVGEHDFSAFRAAECQAKTPWRFIESVSVVRQAQWLVIDICGNAFLHHMVRNIVGSLLPIGDGRREGAWLGEVLASKDRKQAGVTAPAFGLYFYQVDYPVADNIPRPKHLPFPLP